MMEYGAIVVQGCLYRIVDVKVAANYSTEYALDDFTRAHWAGLVTVPDDSRLGQTAWLISYCYVTYAGDYCWLVKVPTSLWHNPWNPQNGDERYPNRIYPLWIRLERML